MNRFIVICLLTTSSIFGVCQTPHIVSGSTVYIDPMDGYETYLAAAFMKKQVPLIMVADRSQADYIIRGSASHFQGAQPAVVVNNTNNVDRHNGGSYGYIGQGMQDAVAQGEASRIARGSTTSSIAILDARSSQIMFAYTVGKNGNTNQLQSAAEACAKHIKKFIEKPKK